MWSLYSLFVSLTRAFMPWTSTNSPEDRWIEYIFIYVCLLGFLHCCTYRLLQHIKRYYISVDVQFLFQQNDIPHYNFFNTRSSIVSYIFVLQTIELMKQSFFHQTHRRTLYHCINILIIVEEVIHRLTPTAALAHPHTLTHSKKSHWKHLTALKKLKKDLTTKPGI